jgi:antitoxin component YwqK of YwqJK toxin-antitoxin module
MLFEIQFKDGRKHGTSRFWYKNGQQKSLLTFKNGQPSGKYKLWDKSGKLVEEDIH